MKISVTAKRMILGILVSSLIFIAAGAAYYRSYSVFPFAIGVLLMAALNILKVLMLERVVRKAVDMDDKKDASNFIRAQYLLRLLLTGIVLFIAATDKVPFVNLWGAVAGIFTMQIAAFSLKFFPVEDEDTDTARDGG
jgi:predicted PurR-regulated permease PerM